MAPVKEEKKSWRELKEKKKKWKAERNLKKLEKLEKLKEAIEVQEQEKVQVEKIVQTCSIAVPGSILENAQSNELRAYLAGQIARAACIYKIDEVIVYDDLGVLNVPGKIVGERNEVRRCCTQFARLLQYLECPQYLRKSFFPLHKDLQHAGLMNPLDAPHHLRQDEQSPYREGIVTNKAVKLSSKGSLVNIGLLQEAFVKETLTPGLRVTVKLLSNENKNSKKIKGTVVPPDTPVKESNTYWGYSVRVAQNLSDVFFKSPYKNGYDLTIGTSDKGENIDDVKKKGFRNCKHVLIVFGGLKGLEEAVENDSNITVSDPSLLFDCYLNTCPSQGSRTIRTEEAVLVTLSELRKFVLFQK